jgi:hypothetical protein
MMDRQRMSPFQGLSPARRFMIGASSESAVYDAFRVSPLEICDGAVTGRPNGVE